MLAEMFSFVKVAGETLLKLIPISIALGIVFGMLTHWSACNPGRPWWRKQEIVTDVCYWFLIPLVARFVRIGLMVMGAALFYNIHGTEALINFYDDGFGPLAVMPLWAQAIFFVVVSDFLTVLVSSRSFTAPRLEISRRASLFERARLDLRGAISPGQYLSRHRACRCRLLLAGISPNAMLIGGPFTTASSAFVHANLNWTLGPFKYVLAGPVFHRWHHTAADRGGSKNFAGTFPVWDLIFGTFYMPKNVLPDAYGVDDTSFPESIGAQMLYPFRQ